MIMPSFVSAATITGKITDDKGNPVAFSTVCVSELGRLAAADKYSVYAIENIPKGKYTLVISCVGFETVKRRMDMKSEKLSFNVSLREKATELSEVYVNSADTALMILDKLAATPKLRKRLKNFKTSFCCRIESVGNLNDCPSDFRKILRFYTGLMGCRKIFKYNFPNL